jgi:D-beta-D-heptose 7-phosphate kinase / D-beta-D-heptose 1-phosphate adenosyltransferase
MSPPSPSGPPAAPADKIVPAPALLGKLARPRDFTLVFTNGVFDILHRGHVAYLDAARRLGDRLVVALNSDASVQRLKGPARPINSLDDRAFVLAGLDAVDFVTAFDDDTPRGLIARLLPDVLVKGGDYSPETVVGREEVEAAGGRLVIIPFVEGRSTTGILNRIRNEP